MLGGSPGDSTMLSGSPGDRSCVNVVVHVIVPHVCMDNYTPSGPSQFFSGSPFGWKQEIVEVVHNFKFSLILQV